LNCFARNTGGRGEIDQGKDSRTDRPKISEQLVGTKSNRPIVEQVDSKAAKHNSQCKGSTGKNIQMEQHILFNSLSVSCQEKYPLAVFG